MWQRIAVIVRKEFRQALRDPRMRILLFLPPLIQLLIFGYAVNLDVEQARIAWVDMDRTPATLELLEAFTGSGRFRVVAVPSNFPEAQAELDRGHADAVVALAPGFGRDLDRGRTAAVQLLVDGSNSNTASIVAQYAQSVVARYGNRVLLDRQQSRLVGPTMAAGEAIPLGIPSVQAESRVWFNPDLRSRNYFVPGVIINIITIVTLMLTAMAIVREKEIGTMEQLLVTPVRPIEVMLGKMLPFAAVGLLDLFFITTAALLVFGIPLRGNILMLVLAGVLFLLSTLGAGLFMSTISQTQQQAVVSSFFFFMPAFMLSGFAFPIRNMPDAVQLITYLNPLRYAMRIVRHIFLKGSGAAVLWNDLLALLLFGTAILTISALRFHKRLD